MRPALTLSLLLLCFGAGVSGDEGDWDGGFYEWIWGPEASVTVGSLNSSRESSEEEDQQGTSLLQQLFSLVKPQIQSEIVINAKPLWEKDSDKFPALGLDGVLIKSEPVHACTRVEPHPEYPTTIEEVIEEIDLNTTHVGRTKWILIAKEGKCTIEQKLGNAEKAGYAAILILSTDPTSDEDLTNIKELKIFGAKVAINDGLTLIENYAYPEPAAAKLEDLRNLQWTHSIYKIIGMVIAAILLLLSLYGIFWKLYKLRRRWKEEKAARELQETLRRAIETMPLTIWELNQMTKDEKCHICYGLFYPNDVVRTLPCYHRFHQRCIVTRFENLNTECAVCHYQIITPEKKSTESTPLL